MTIGSGIAVAGVWLMPIACAFAPRVSGLGMCIAIACAMIATGWIVR